ncbi:MAG: mobile mystery protein B [Spirochaetales bacterium]
MNLEDLPGATHLNADEIIGLKPLHLTTQHQLDEWEQLNILEGETWAKRYHGDLLDQTFLRRLHEKMFGETWSWAGHFRLSDKNIGVPWAQIPMKLKDLADDVRYQIDNRTFPNDEIAARFHHRLVFIHPFPNGNGRWARFATDLLIQRLGHCRFSWGRDSLIEDTETRSRYLAALRAADGHHLELLLEFVRS